MQNLTPTPRGQRPPLADFTPVPRRYRYDGWTAERQKAFIEALADTGSVKHAARRINMSPEGAYYLRRQPGSDGFRKAWDAALDFGVQSLVDIAIDRAKEGVAVPVFYKGEQVGERRWYNDRLLMFILKHHMPSKYGAELRGGTKHPDTLLREMEEDDPDGEQALAVIRERVDRIRQGLMRQYEDRRAEIRRVYYDRYAHDPAKRAAWETLHERPIETLLEPAPALPPGTYEQGGEDEWAMWEDWRSAPED